MTGSDDCPVAVFRQKRLDIAIERLNDDLPPELRAVYEQAGKDEVIEGWNSHYESIRFDAVFSLLALVAGSKEAVVKALEDRMELETSIRVFRAINQALTQLGCHNAKDIPLEEIPLAVSF